MDKWQKPPDKMTQAEMEEALIAVPALLDNFIANTLKGMTLMREKRERLDYCFRLAMQAIQRREERIVALQESLKPQQGQK